MPQYGAASVGEEKSPARATNGKARLQWAHYQNACWYRSRVWDDRIKQVGEYLWGNQGIRQTTKAHQSDFVYNLIYKDHQLGLSMLARDVPRIKLMAYSPANYHQAEPVSQMIAQTFAQNDFVVRMVEMLNAGLPFGMSFFKVTWDATMNMGLGGVRIEFVDPRNMYFMPGIASIRKSLVLTEKQCLDKLTVFHMYKDDWKATNDLFKKARDYGDEGYPGGEDGGDRRYIEPEDGNTTYLTRGVRGVSEKQYVELCQQWYIDPTTIKMVPKLYDYAKSLKGWKDMQSDQQDEFLNKPIYPRGRLAVFCEDHLYDSRLNPFPSFPYMQYMNQFIPVMKPGDELGMGEYDQGLEMQDAFNARKNQLNDGMDRTGTRALTAEDVDREEWTSDPYGVFSGIRGPVQQVTTPPPSAEAFRSVNDEFAIFREVQNRSDVSQGANPSGVRSADQVTALSDNANRVMVTRTHSLEACVRSVARYLIAMYGAYYKPGMHYPESLDLTGMNPDAFEIDVAAGMNLPASEAQRLMWIRTLREMQAIDNEAVLDATPESYLPNKAELMERMRGKWAAEAQAMQQQQEAEVGEQEAAAQNQRSQAINNVIPMPQGAM